MSVCLSVCQEEEKDKKRSKLFPWVEMAPPQSQLVCTGAFFGHTRCRLFRTRGKATQTLLLNRGPGRIGRRQNTSRRCLPLESTSPRVRHLHCDLVSSHGKPKVRHGKCGALQVPSACFSKVMMMPMMMMLMVMMVMMVMVNAE